MITKSSIVEKLGPIGEWNVIEAMLKATIVPNLPINVLAELYNQLTVANWRQSNIVLADLYNKKAEELAKRCGDKSVLAEALLSKANIFSWRGKTEAAIRTYRECLRLEKHIEQKILGSICSNLGAVLYESGDLDQGEEWQRRSLEFFSLNGKPMNLSISWCHLAIISLQRGDLLAAKLACEKSRTFAVQDEYLRGIEAAKIIDSEILAREGEPAIAMKMLKESMAGFTKLGIEEAENYEFAGRVSRLLGDNAGSLRFLRKGVELARDFPLYLGSIYFELGKTLLNQNASSTEVQDSLNKATALFTECEAPIRVKQVKNFIKTMK